MPNPSPTRRVRRKEERFFRPKWGLLWQSRTQRGVYREHLMFQDGRFLMFQDRKHARAYAAEKYGYIKRRPDLRCEPHGWKMPQPVKLLAIVWSR